MTISQDSVIRLSDLISPAFYVVHHAVIEHLRTHYMLGGGRGSGKSSFVSIELWLLMLRHPHVNAVVLRKVAGTIRTSVFEQVLWAMDMLGLRKYCKITTSPPCITYLPTGQRILFRGLDDKSKLKSLKLSYGYIGIVWYEEMDEFFGMEEIRSVNQSLGRGGQDVWFFYTYNPPKTRDNWVNEEALQDREGWLHHHSTYLTTPPEWLGESFIAEAEDLKKRKPLAYQHEYMGEPTGTGGTIFENVVERRITDDEIDTMGYFYRGIDFGFAVDPFVWVYLSYDKRGNKIYILDEIYQTNLLHRQAAERIKQKNRPGVITADSQAPGSIRELKEYGLEVRGAKKGPGSIEHGIRWLQGLNEIVIDKTRTPETYKEFYKYEYVQDKNGKFVSEYPDKNNHSIDAVRYALESEINIRKLDILGGKGF